MNKFMNRVLQLADQNISAGGWPFAALIVKDGQIIAEGVNSVHATCDPSDHAEIAAIRKATTTLSSADLSNCTMYVVGLPCPMCATCIVLSELSDVRYAVGVEHKDKALSKLPPTDGLYNLVSTDYGASKISYTQLQNSEQAGVALFEKWNNTS